MTSLLPWPPCERPFHCWPAAEQRVPGLIYHVSYAHSLTSRSASTTGFTEILERSFIHRFDSIRENRGGKPQKEIRDALYFRLPKNYIEWYMYKIRSFSIGAHDPRTPKFPPGATRRQLLGREYPALPGIRSVNNGC